MVNIRTHLHPHVVLLPNSGMGHLSPFLRLAASLVQHQCQVTLITCHPIVSLAESELISRFFSAFPHVSEKQFHLLPCHPNLSKFDDPFMLQWKAARYSVHLLPPLLSSISPSPNVLVFDVTLISSVIPIAKNLNLPVYTLFTSSARMLALFAYYPIASSKYGLEFSHSSSDIIDIPSGLSMSKSVVPPLLLVPGSIFSSIFMEDGQNIKQLDGILINTFDKLEADTLNALKSGKVIDGLPKLFTVGLMPCEFERGGENLEMKWLDDQLPESVVYVSFGSKVAMSREQIKEMGNGLVRSGYPFLWVVKDKVVDKEDTESLNDVLGDELMEKMKEKGLVVKEWVNQGEIISHKAVGGFMSHCGWNSVIESAWNGVPLLAWPTKGDQKVNSEVMEKSGLGLCNKAWGWVGERVVKGEEIGERIKEFMELEELKVQAAQIREEARKAVAHGGSCENSLLELVHEWNNFRVHM